MSYTGKTTYWNFGVYIIINVGNKILVYGVISSFLVGKADWKESVPGP